jgi:hypothetical protein
MVLEATLFDIVSWLAKWLIVFIQIMHLDSVPSSGESTPCPSTPISGCHAGIDS